MPGVRLLLTLALLTAAAPAAAAPAGRGLTAGERALLRPWFGTGLDYDAVRVVPDRLMPLQPSKVYMTHEGRIYAPGHLYRDDFAAREVSDHLRAVFIHEVVHAWQHQRGMNVMAAGLRDFFKGAGDYRESYEYELVRGRELTDYGMEQQAAIVEDYVRVKALGLQPEWLKNRALSRRELLARYRAVLRRFPDR